MMRDRFVTVLAYVVAIPFGLLAGAVTVGAVLPFALFQSFVLLELWNWYLPALGVRPISFGAAFGLDLILAAFVVNPVRTSLRKSAEEEKKAKAKAKAKIEWRRLLENQVGVYLFALAIGYLAHRYLVP